MAAVVAFKALRQIPLGQIGCAAAQIRSIASISSMDFFDRPRRRGIFEPVSICSVTGWRLLFRSVVLGVMALPNKIFRDHAQFLRQLFKEPFNLERRIYVDGETVARTPPSHVWQPETSQPLNSSFFARLDRTVLKPKRPLHSGKDFSSQDLTTGPTESLREAEDV